MLTVGSEYTLCIALILLMSAVVSFLSESVVESLRGAYKLRKAYQLLHKMYDMIVEVDGTRSDSTKVDTENDGSDGSEEFVDAAEEVDSSVTLSRSIRTLELSQGETRAESISISSRRSSRRFSITTVSSFYDVPSHPQSNTSLTDQTVYSATLMALGAIMLLISLLPPSLSRLLSIIGFRGTRSQALSMLWKVSSHPGPFGALATFVVGSYYGNIVQNSDIVSDQYHVSAQGNGVATLDRLHTAIVEVRKRYPSSALWAVEEVCACFD